MFWLSNQEEKIKKLSEDVYKLSKEMSLLNDRITKKEHKENIAETAMSIDTFKGKTYYFSMMNDGSLEIECIEGMTCDKLCTLASKEVNVLRRLLNEYKD